MSFIISVSVFIILKFSLGFIKKYLFLKERYREHARVGWAEREGGGGQRIQSSNPDVGLELRDHVIMT